MKIGNVGKGKGVERTKRTQSAQGSGSSAFADQLRSASAPSGAGAPEPGVVDTVAVEGVDALLAMQEAGDSTEERACRQAASYGEDLLERLRRLQDALLIGAIPKESLMDLAKKIRTGRTKIDDPRLNAILDEIELRAEVEIAKFTRGT